MYKIFVFVLLCFVVSGCSQGVTLGPGTDTTLASAAQDECGFVQNVYGQRVSWKSRLPVRMFISREALPNEAVIRAAAQIWEDAAGLKLFDIVNEDDLSYEGGKDSRNGIYWNPNWTKSPNYQAITTLYWSGNQIIESDMTINSKYYHFYIENPELTSDLHLSSLLIHEFGHVLGLKHRSTLSTVMWPVLNAGTKRDVLTDADRKALKCEY
ncbi:matrixin family metalloprotease [Bdellovibrio sp. GT3]|uniref:matrixin family metalloprotease n=1 Tax=Bdellovibrio sp. GT3 TaxID=3136282 RepID=UPI0030F2A49B